MSRGPIPDKPRDRPTVPEVLPLARAYMEATSWVGGNLHIVLGDGNLEEDHIRWTRLRASEEHDADAVVIADAMLAMTGTQRRKLYAKLWASPVGRSLIEFDSAIVVDGLVLNPDP